MFLVFCKGDIKKHIYVSVLLRTEIIQRIVTRMEKLGYDFIGIEKRNS